MAECGGSFAGGDTYAGAEDAEGVTEESSVTNVVIWRDALRLLMSYTLHEFDPSWLIDVFFVLSKV